MKIYNTLSRKIEKFEPINPPHVGMYTCGPTVYDYQHIGNFRTMVLSDLINRVLKYNGYKVRSVRNITDIDDKIIKNAAAKNMPIGEYSKEYTRIFFEDLEKLNVLAVDIVTYATEYVGKMITYIQDLIQKGFAYVESDGSVYFEISKFPQYGKLSGIERKELKTGTRVLSDEYTKDNVQDFALWKSVGPDEREGYDSPWGRGRPGWHIECSVMSQENLGDTFDIHVGGRDLLFPHHENEIAQSEAKTGKKFVDYWVHGEFLNVDGGKMSKSLKNFYTIKDIEKKGFDPLTLRYFYFSAHYRTVLNFTWEALEASQTELARLRAHVARLRDEPNGMSFGSTAKFEDVKAQFLAVVNDDLNMPTARAVLWSVLGDDSLSAGEKLKLVLDFDRVFGLKLDEVRQIKKQEKVPQEVLELARERERLRETKKFAEADKVREKIEEMGYTVNDTTDGSRVVARD